MTLAVLFEYKESNSIFFLADGLISTEIESSGNFIMPGKGVVGRPNSDYGFFEGIEQKLNVVGSNLAFIWSGRRELVQKFAIEVFEIYKNASFNYEKLKQFLDHWPSSLNKNDSKEIKLIVIFQRSEDYAFWNFGTEEFHGYKHFKKLWITGTGRNNFLNLIGSDMDNVECDDQAFGHAMNILNRFYYDDLFIHSNYSNAFGGFYELASCRESGIEKYSDILITSLIIDAKQLERGVKMPFLILKYDVYDGLSIIRELQAVESDTGADFINRGHAYLPLIPEHRDKAIEASNEILSENEFYNSKIIGDMKAKHTLVMLNLVDGKYERQIPLFFYEEDRNTPVVLSVEADHVAIQYKQVILDSINQKIEKFIDRETSTLKSDEEL